SIADALYPNISISRDNEFAVSIDYADSVTAHNEDGSFRHSFERSRSFGKYDCQHYGTRRDWAFDEISSFIG
ncbi:hypothetical protein OY671_011110, partial [Metschnikowia pulcherrima]